MGTTHVTVTIRNPVDPKKCWEGLFLVDTGAIDSLVPRDCLESVGLPIKAQRTYELADGNDIKMDICLLYTSPSPRDLSTSRMPSSA